MAQLGATHRLTYTDSLTACRLPSAQLKRGSLFVQGEIMERWKQLCEEAAVEQDPKKLIKLVSGD